MNDDLGQLELETLTRAHSIFLELLREGTAHDEVGINQFGEMAIRIDIAMEVEVIKAWNAIAIKA